MSSNTVNGLFGDKGIPPKVALYSGARVSAGTLPLNEDYTLFDELEIHCEWTVGGTRRKAVGTVVPDMLLDAGTAFVDAYNFYLTAANNAYFRFAHNPSTLELTVESAAPVDVTLIGVYKVMGVRYA